MSYTINSTQQQDKVAIILWLYHIDLWPEFYSLLKPLADNIVLYLGLCDSSLSDYPDIKRDIDLFDYRIYYQNNYGCDVAPFLNQIQMVSEPVFIKIHSKKSLWGVKNIIQWRSVLLNGLIGSKKIFDNNIIRLSDPNVGMICNENLLLKEREGKNTEIIQKISNMINMNYDHVANSSFPAGNMFCSKTSIYHKYFTPEVCDQLNFYLKQEQGKVDDKSNGTYSHSLERIFGYIIKQENKIFNFPEYDIIKVLNNQAPNSKYYSLIKTYNNNCYLEEDLNAYGNIIDQRHNEMTIEWLHMPTKIYQKYNIINKNTIIKEKNAKNSIS